MTKGFTDWDVPVNINAQTLGEIISRPKYGAAELLSSLDEVTTDGLTPIVSVSGTGMLYGGFMHFSAAELTNTASVDVIIDNATIFTLTFSSLFLFGPVFPQSYIGYLQIYNIVDHIFSIGFSYGVTFESSIEFLVRRRVGVRLVVNTRIYFATI